MRSKYHQRPETESKIGKSMFIAKEGFAVFTGCGLSAAVFYAEYIHRSRQDLHREDLEKAFEVVNALAKYKPQIRLTTNGTNHIKELLQNTQIFNEPV